METPDGSAENMIEGSPGLTPIGLSTTDQTAVGCAGCSRFEDDSADVEAGRGNGLRVDIIDCVITGFFGIYGDDDVAPIRGLEEAPIAGDGEVDGADFASVPGYWGVCAAP